MKSVERARAFTASPTYPRSDNLGDEVRLLGFDLAGSDRAYAPAAPASARVGEKLRATLYWQAARDLSTSYTVFAQVLNGEGKLVAQHDGLPGAGTAPTTGWVPDEVVKDEHVIALSPDLPPGGYSLIVGLYDASTGKRLPVVEEGRDYIVIVGVQLTD